MFFLLLFFDALIVNARACVCALVLDCQRKRFPIPSDHPVCAAPKTGLIPLLPLGGEFFIHGARCGAVPGLRWCVFDSGGRSKIRKQQQQQQLKSVKFLSLADATETDGFCQV